MPYEIVPHLFLGDARDAGNVENFSMVINCTKDVPFYSDTTVNIRIPVNDTPDEAMKIIEHWNGCLDTIAKEIEKGNDVLIHCQMGRQRSAATAAAYLIKYHGHDKADAVSHIRNIKREAFFPYINFDTALCILQVAK